MNCFFQPLSKPKNNTNISIIKLISSIVLFVSLISIFCAYSNNKFLPSGFRIISSFVFLDQTYQIKNKSEKYVLYECGAQNLCGGLADRFKAIINAYAWSLFTNRTLIVNITKPCFFERLISPKSVKWNLNLRKLVKTGDLPENYSIKIIDQIDNFSFKDVLAKLDIQKHLENTHVIRLFTNIEWISAFNKNKYLNLTVQNLGFKYGEFNFWTSYNKWFSRLFKLSPEIEAKFKIYKKKIKFDSTTPLICVQVRIGGSRPNVAYDEELTPRNFSIFYWKFVREKFLANIIGDYRIFVTADTESVEREAIKEFGSNKTVVITGVSTHVDREANMMNDCSRYEKIVMDFWMLGFCDMALVSDSGFGVFGLLRTKIPKENFYLLTARINKTSDIPEIFELYNYIHSNPHRY